MKILRTFAGGLLAKVGFYSQKQSNLSNRGEPPNQSSSVSASAIQSALRLAESGDTRQLFALYRDVILTGSHPQCEFSKRKTAVLADPPTILPVDKNNPDDVAAAEAVKAMIAGCENWTDGMVFLMDSCLWPVSAAEKIFRPVDPEMDPVATVPLRFMLRRFEPVNHGLLCFKQPEGFKETGWESALRFYSTDDAGKIVNELDKTYQADPNRHVIHRGHTLVGIRDNWGGPMRAVLGWWFLGQLGRDWFGRFMERFGNPFIVARVDSTNKDAVEFLQEALSLATKIGGMVVDTETQVELKEAALSGGADGFERFLGVCNREISKIIVGQELSATASATGLGSGVANLQSGVRDDIRSFDQQKLSQTLRQQVFAQFLQINGLRGAVPQITWGGADDKKAELSGALLQALGMAGLRPSDAALPVLSERFGFAVERAAAPAQPAFGRFNTFAADEGGWITTEDGVHVFLQKGETVHDAFKRLSKGDGSGSEKKSSENSGGKSMTVREIRDELKQRHGISRDQADDHIYEQTGKTAKNDLVHDADTVKKIHEAAQEKFKARREAAEKQKADLEKAKQESEARKASEPKSEPKMSRAVDTSKIPLVEHGGVDWKDEGNDSHSISGVKVARETEKAFLVEHNGRQEWFPKSQTKIDGDKLTAPGWMKSQKFASENEKLESHAWGWKGETEKAYILDVSYSGKHSSLSGSTSVILPKSQVRRDSSGNLHIPRWLKQAKADEARASHSHISDLDW